MTISIVQHVQVNGGGGTISFASNITPGNAVLYSGLNPNTVTIAGNSEALTRAVIDSDNEASIWYYTNVGASPGKIINFGASCIGDCWEVAGLATTGVLDKTSSDNNTSGSSSFTSGTTAATTAASEFWLGTAAVEAVPTGPSSPWTNEAVIASEIISGYQIRTATGAAVYAGTLASSTVWFACIATFKGAASPAAPASLLLPQPPWAVIRAANY